MNSKRKVQKELKESIEKAMPSVKEIVKKFGKSIVYSCILRLSIYDKKMEKINFIKKNK